VPWLGENRRLSPAHGSNPLSRRLLIACLVPLLLAGSLAGLDRLLPPDLSRYQDRSVLVVDRQGEVLRGFTTADEKWRLACRPDQVDPAYLAMLIGFEDRRFRYHPGVDPLALARAVAQSLYHGRIVSGASTLTMQVARLLEPRPRGLKAKLIEMARAVQLEARYSKDDILAMYLTLAPFGGNLEGVRAASLAYLGREPRSLTPAQAAMLVALPQSPTRRRPDGPHPQALTRAADKVLAQAHRAGRLSDQTLAEARQETLPRQRKPLPFLAPHAAERLARKAAPGAIIPSTLDGRLQQAAETMLVREARWIGDGAVIAALIVDVAGRQVRAWVGAHDFAAPGGGQIDLARAIRSPGSTLKPFIYALGLEDQVIAADTRIDDRPLRFGDYAPQNFDRGFHGRVTMREALQQSLNLPAVAVLDRIGPARFAADLDHAGIKLVLPTGIARPSLPLALGGVGMSLADLTSLYGSLADGGLLRPLALQPGPTAAGVRLMSADSARQITAILADAPRPDGFGQMRAGSTGGAGQRRIAYKTGTSYGFRDALALGHDGRHVVAVWVGRADGTPRPGSYGRNTAAPLLFRLFDLLPDTGDALAHLAPDRQPMASLPPRLRRFSPPGGSIAIGGAPDQAPAILFPPDGAELELDRDQRDYSLALKAEGGQTPLRWLVNGLPVASDPWRRDTAWTPDGEGFVRITVIDAADRSTSVRVRLR